VCEDRYTDAGTENSGASSVVPPCCHEAAAGADQPCGIHRAAATAQVDSRSGPGLGV
jgi:hypothetical protein